MTNERALNFMNYLSLQPGVTTRVIHHKPSSEPKPRKGRRKIVQFPAQLRDVVKAGIESLVATNNPPTLFVHAESLSVIDIKTQEARPLSSSQLKLAISE